MATTAALAAQLAAMNETLTAISGLTETAEDGTVSLLAGSFTSTGDSNTAWLLQSGYLVFFMQAGFAMLCAGSVRAKNAKNIILLNILDACLGSVCWYLTGYAFAFGDKGNAFISYSNFALSGVPTESYGFWFFQFTFAATAATIVSGAVAERCKFQTYVLYEMILVLFVYPVMAHWVWNGVGWASALNADKLLFSTGVYDFAGDGPVHMIGGFASLAAAYILGPRIGRFDASGQPQDMPGHSVTLILLGVFLLWFGWYGFNPGSTLAIEGYSALAATVAVNTTLAAATGAISCFVVNIIHSYTTTGLVVYDVIMVGNGALAGLVSITGPCGFVRPWAALPIGLAGGAIYFGCSKLILRLKIDDPLDAIAVHAGCGMWGMIAGGLLAAPEVVTVALGSLTDAEGNDLQRNYGLFMGGGGKLLAAHLVYILVIAAWSLGIMTPFFLLLKSVNLFRVEAEVEAAGLDVSHHGGSAYPHEPKAQGAAMAGGVSLTAEMVDRKIAEALAAAAKA
jgi:Amt family ammonium transporter